VNRRLAFAAVVLCAAYGASVAAAPAGVPAFLPAETAARCAAQPAPALHRLARAALAERGVRNPEAWTDAVFAALCGARLAVSAENVALVFALIERESSFHPHGLLPNPPDAFRKLAYRVIDDLLAGEAADYEQLLGPQAAARFAGFAVRALRDASLVDRDLLRRSFDAYDRRFGWSRRVFTEWDVEHVVARDLLVVADELTPVGVLLRGALAWEPRWRSLLAEGRLFRSIGPLQVNPEAAVALASQDGLATDLRQARARLYTIEAGVYYGVRQLQPLIDAYAGRRPLDEASAGFVAADWRQGFLYACRDAAAVALVARLAGRPLRPDTPLRSQAVRALLLELDLPRLANASAVDALLAAAGNPGLEQVPLHAELRAAYRARFGEEPASAVVPDLRYTSAKTGRYRLRTVVEETRRRFTAYCVRLGCSR
jgi:hypothetical protein